MMRSTNPSTSAADNACTAAVFSMLLRSLVFGNFPVLRSGVAGIVLAADLV